MPEGDTVFKLAHYLRPALKGYRLLGGRLAPRPEADLSGIMLAGRRVEDVFARGKHLFIAFDDGRLLRSHLGMHGSWHGYARDESWQRPTRQASIVLETEPRVFVCFNAAQVEWLLADGLRERSFRQGLGPDLLGDGLDADGIARRARTRPASTPIADVLLDQRIACGVGNVYKSEVLFIERLHPLTRLDQCDDDRLRSLYRQAADLLHANLGSGPRITRHARDQAGGQWVYGRTGLPCLACDAPILSARLGGHQRSTFWCPVCQKAEDAVEPAG